MNESAKGGKDLTIDLVNDFTGSFVVDVSSVGDGENSNDGDDGDGGGTLRVVFVDGLSVGVEPRPFSSIAFASFSYLLSWCHFQVVLSTEAAGVGVGVGVVVDCLTA